MLLATFLDLLLSQSLLRAKQNRHLLQMYTQSSIYFNELSCGSANCMIEIQYKLCCKFKMNYEYIRLSLAMCANMLV